RDDRFDDRGLVTADVGGYKPNAWGLCDMHGNAAEWTRSALRPYPYKDDDGRNLPKPADRLVVRGGSWRERPKRCTSAFRLGYEPWRKVYNVGFRVVVEIGTGAER
ncbi:MAG: SUMF1/EgtB/PvdO family nonheme iron enzyme, partial [Phycisphaerae bacterium]|nr:SUMF1/EgtB/PvdO family nonheme iron enzyme [Phycisphaerae bacterium]